MDQGKFKERTKNELKDALVYFIDRQNLVAQAMLDLGLDLDLVGQFGAFAWVSGTWTLDDKTKSWLKQLGKLFAGDKYAPGEQALIEAIKRNTERQFSQRGTWGNDDKWEYFLHGGGCLLTNKETGEPINWDCPNIKSFDVFFFHNHLKWQLKWPDRKNHLKHLQLWIDKYEEASIDELIDEMKRDGIIENHQIMEGLKNTLKDK